jgi:predicted NUDIX family phosphoesterase
MESILVVPRQELTKRQLLRDGMISLAELGISHSEFSELVHTHGQFHPRSAMEQDPNYKQIIPYMVYLYNDQVFLMQRRSSAGESRLAGKHTLGIGGHVRKEDIEGVSLEAWGEREFCEEVAYADGFEKTEVLGFVNDDQTDVGRVHLGVVFVMHGKSAEIAVKEELASGLLVSYHECMLAYDRMEVWSQMVLTTLHKAGIFGLAPELTSEHTVQSTK